MDVPVDVVFEDEGCGRWGGEEASQGVQVAEPGERGAAGYGGGGGGAEVRYVFVGPGWLERDGDVEGGDVGGVENAGAARRAWAGDGEDEAELIVRCR